MIRPLVVATGLGGNTMNLFLRCCKQGTKAPKGGCVAADEHGFLSLAALERRSPAAAAAARRGTPWLVLAATMRTEEPEALRVIQAAENQQRAVGRLANDIEMVRRACQQVGDGGFSNLAEKKALELRLANDAPHLRDCVPGYVGFALQMRASAGAAGAGESRASVHLERLTGNVGRFLKRGPSTCSVHIS